MTSNNIKRVKFDKYLFVIWFLSFVINVSLIWIRTTPVITDEFNPLGYAFLSAGFDMKTYFAADGYYYKYGQLLLYFLPVYFLKKTSFLFPILLLINSIVVSFLPVIFYRILIELSNDAPIKKEYYIYSFLIGMLPDVLLNAKLIWAEPILMVIGMLALLLLLKIYNTRDRNSWVYSALLGIVQVFAYVLHSRGIVIIITTSLIIIYMRFFLKRRDVKWLIFLSISVLLLLLDKYLSHYFQNVVYGSVSLVGNSGNADSFAFLKYIFSKNGLLTLFHEIIGWIFASANGTFGLLIVGLVAAFQRIWGIIRAREFDSIENVCLLWILFYFIGSLLMGTLFFLDGIYDESFSEIVRRGDKLIYSRYIAGPAIILSLWGVWEWKETKRINRVSLFISLIVLLYADIFTYLRILPRIDNTITYPHITITINSFCDLSQSNRGGLYEPINQFGMSIMLYAMCILGFLFVLFLTKTKKVFPFLILCLVVYYTNSYNTLYFMDQYMYEKTEQYSDILDFNYITEKTTVYIDDEILRTGYQYRYPDYRIASPRDTEDLGNSIIYIGKCKLKSTMKYPEYRIVEDEDRNLFVYGDNLANELCQRGYAVIPIE